MDNNHTFATRFVTDLVNQGLICKEVNGKWTLAQPILGIQGNVTFNSKEEIIQGLVKGRHRALC